MGKYVDGSGLSHFMGILKGYFVPQTRTVNGHPLSSDVTVSKADVGLGSTANGAEVNQNAFSNVKVGSTTVAADSKTDTLELVAGTNVTLTPDATNDKVTISAVDSTFDPTYELDLTGYFSDAHYTMFKIYVSDQDGNEYGDGVELPVMNGSQAGIVTPTILDNYDTKYSAGTGLSLGTNNVINHSNSVTAGTIGSTSATSGTTIAVPYATYDAQGHITGKGTHNHTLGAAAAKAVDTSIATGSTSANLPTSAAVATAISTAMSDVAGALVYKGTLGTGGTVTTLPANHTKGWYYIVKTAGTYAGVVCEPGDMVICHESGTSANNAHWDVVQTNIETLSNSEIDTLWTQAA